MRRREQVLCQGLCQKPQREGKSGCRPWPKGAVTAGKGFEWDGGGSFGMSYLAFVTVFSLGPYLLCWWFFFSFLFLFFFFLGGGRL